VWKVLNGAGLWQRHIVEKLNALFLSFHYKRYNQNKADTTVNKTETCLNLLVQSWTLSIERFVSMVPCLLGFIFLAMPSLPQD